jgi:hypothetical protein
MGVKLELFRPFFWAAPRPLGMTITERKVFRCRRGPAMEEIFDTDLSGYPSLAEFAAAHTKSRDDLHERSGKLFAMEAMSPTNIIPIFGP